MSRMSTKGKKSTLFLLSSAAGIFVGFIFNKYGKDKVKDFYTTARQKVSDTESKWYLDGEKGAIDLEQIKQSVNDQLK